MKTYLKMITAVCIICFANLSVAESTLVLDLQEKLNKMNANNRRESEEIEESSSPLAEEINLGRTIASKGLLSLYA